MHVHDDYLATKISLKDVKNISGVRVTMYTMIEKCKKLITSDGTVLNIKECGSGLYYYSMEILVCIIVLK